jgi:hypothetical protein
MDVGTASAVVAGSFAASTPFRPEACSWAVSEIAGALGLSSPAPGAPRAPGVPPAPGSPAAPGAPLGSSIPPGSSVPGDAQPTISAPLGVAGPRAAPGGYPPAAGAGGYPAAGSPGGYPCGRHSRRLPRGGGAKRLPARGRAGRLPVPARSRIRATALGARLRSGRQDQRPGHSVAGPRDLVAGLAWLGRGLGARPGGAQADQGSQPWWPRDRDRRYRAQRPLVADPDRDDHRRCGERLINRSNCP